MKGEATMSPSQLERLEHPAETRSGKISLPTNQSQDWTIKGLPKETVEISREAAKNNGMKINAWVSKALNQAASKEHVDVPRAHETDSDESFREHVLQQLEKIKERDNDLIATVNSMSAILLKLYAKERD